MIEALDWTKSEEFDRQIWQKLVAQFWVPEEFVISNDIPTWEKMSKDEKWLVMQVFAGLTLLDTLQGEYGAPSLEESATSQHEIAVYKNIAFMEMLHASSYSYIFQTLAPSDSINDAFEWAKNDKYLQNKAEIIKSYYVGDDQLKRKVASTFLESFLFYSGFYLPLYLSSRAKLTNTADLVRTIVKDEVIHGTYIGFKFQQQFEQKPAGVQEDIKEWAYDLLNELYENEVQYTQSLYDPHGLTEDVKSFLRYNANKALANLGMDPLFPHEEVNPVILNGLDTRGVTQDFFSSKGNYSNSQKVEEMSDDDFADFEF